MPAPLDPDRRAAIEQAIRDGAGTRSAGSIAKEHGVGRTTVLRIAEQASITGAWDRTKTKNATHARTVDNASRRAALAAAMLDDAEFFRAKFRQDWTKTIVIPGVGSSQVEADSAEVATGLQRLMTSVGIAVDKHVALEKYDVPETGAEDAKSMLLGVADGLRTLYVASGMADQRPSEQDAPDVPPNR